MSQTSDYDLIVVGAGVGGHAAALHAVACGLETAIVEAAEMGGTCINRGCIPSKALLAAAGRLREIREADKLGISVGQVSFDRAAIAEHANAVVSKIRDDMTQSLQKAKVDIIRGVGKLLAATTVEVTSPEGETSTYTAKDVIIATGSTPFVPPGIETDGKTVFTSDESVRLESLPEKLAIVGSGYIGLEFADVYTALGCKVVVLEALDKLMPAFDPDIARLAQRVLIKGRDIEALAGVLAKKVTPGSPVSIELSTGDSLEVDACLVATGRIPVTRELGLDALGIDTGKRGFVPVNDRLQTDLPHLWAIGDATGKMMLAHVASAQGIAVVNTICDRPSEVDYRSVPAAVFTHPEMGFVGLTEPQAKEAGYKVGTVRTYFGGNSKAIAAGETDGMVKLVYDKPTGELLGTHIFGPHAADLIHEASQAIAKRDTVQHLATLIHTHPTLAETLGEAYHRAAGV
ncbi:dihydrolipoyl dehydrogenase [Synechococcus sp. PCC 7336]|uniref:dihydrolipoyl dehydrogenase n=1 Tax=Synechococcus sp. PCC 7336 TaxID=195250 RepID=UPI000346C779|nr:dihydrolipoyl dehydrogenase [Synechococcus sp. PCC 7336]